MKENPWVVQRSWFSGCQKARETGRGVAGEEKQVMWPKSKAYRLCETLAHT